MEIVKKSKAKKTQSFSSTTVWEYMMKDNDINGAVAEIHGRYPDKGRVVNKESKELVFVIKGKGRLIVEGKEIRFQAGDLLLIEPGERYFWQGKMKLFMANTPRWRSEQHKLVK